jgi:hypothetical protein
MVSVQRVKVSQAVEEYLDDCLDRQGKSGYGLAKTTVDAYRYRLHYLTDFGPTAFLDEIDNPFMKRFRKFLRTHPDDLGDRSCHNIVQAVGTFLTTHEIMAAKQCLKEMSFKPKPVIPYGDEEMTAFFTACNEEEEMVFKFLLHSMGREREVAYFQRLGSGNFSTLCGPLKTHRSATNHYSGLRATSAAIGPREPIPVR